MMIRSRTDLLEYAATLLSEFKEKTSTTGKDKDIDLVSAAAYINEILTGCVVGHTIDTPRVRLSRLNEFVIDIFIEDPLGQ
jgi:hypothetical protein